MNIKNLWVATTWIYTSPYHFQALSIGDDLNWSKTNTDTGIAKPGSRISTFNPSEWWPFNPDDSPSIKMIPAVERSFERKLNLSHWRLISQDWKSKGIVNTCYDGKDCEQKGVVWRCLHEISFEAKTNYCMYKNNCKYTCPVPLIPPAGWQFITWNFSCDSTGWLRSILLEYGKRFPGDSKWPCHPLVRSHAQPFKGSLHFPKKVTKNCRQSFGLLRIELNLSESWV